MHPLAVVLSGLLFLATEATARTVDWTAELATDLVIAGATLTIVQLAPKNARYQGGEFQTQGPDDRVTRLIHGKPTGNTPTKKERNYREASNISVVAAATLPIGLALGSADSDLMAARLMTTSHTLLLSNFFVTAMKHSVRRPRPKSRQESGSVARDDEALSFPSGHSSVAFAGATLITTLFPTSPWWVKTGGFTLAAVSAWARIAGDKHFFTDVLVGGMIGTGSALLTESYFRDSSSPIAPLIERNSVGLSYRF